MAQTTAQLLSDTEDAIAGLLEALTDVNVEEYTIGGRYGRTVRRAEFSATLEVLYKNREILKRAAAADSSTGQPVRVASLGRAQPTDS